MYFQHFSVYKQNNRCFSELFYHAKVKLTSCSCIEKLCKLDCSPVVQVGDCIIKNATIDKILVKIGEEYESGSN